MTYTLTDDDRAEIDRASHGCTGAHLLVENGYLAGIERGRRIGIEETEKLAEEWQIGRGFVAAIRALLKEE